ncbi:MAG: glycoside hydrolase family 6 protein, partial [Actinomycetota bacterium]|nr:glycoside hydrolase family 6 protein [Actinomycetota bacterium]
MISSRIASQPQARWFTVPNAAQTQTEVTNYVNAAAAKGQVPVIVAYALPFRDCGQYSSGGFSNWTDYNTWINAVATAIGSSDAVVILEPDSLGLISCLSSTQLQQRYTGLSNAVSTLKSRSPNARVFLDGGHSNWNGATEQANRLRNAGVLKADGFFSNVSNFRYTSDEVSYGRTIRSILGTQLQQVIDTSRNGRGPLGSEWCDPAGRGLGAYPTLNTGDAGIAGYLWIKPPGEADGCAAGAGQFVPSLAYELAQNAASGTPPSSPTTSPTTSPTATPTPTPTATPTPTPTPTATTTSAAVTSGCSVSYKVDSAWNTGHTATVTITNRGAAVNGWTLTWATPAGQTLANAWNATVTLGSGRATARNVSYNGSLATGASTNFGLQVNAGTGGNGPGTA